MKLNRINLKQLHRRLTRSSGAQAPDDEPTERGAVLMILALLITVLMLCAGFAVDFGSWYARAETLQNAADAAALAGAHEYDLTGDKGLTQARVLDVLQQNGIFAGGDMDVQVSFAGDLDLDNGEVSVRVMDQDVDLYFSTLVIDNMSLRRDATALVDNCGVSCTATLQIPQPFNAVTVTGSGDGYAPVKVGERLYGVNHHKFGADLVCINLADSTSCPGGYPRQMTGVGTDAAPKMIPVGEKLYFVGQQPSQVVLVCWDTVAVAACSGSPVALAPLSGGSGQAENRGGGAIHVNGKIYAFTDNHQVYCVLPDTLSYCPGYPKASGLASDASPMTNGANGSMTASIAYPVGTEAHIYVTTHFDGGSQSSLGVRMHCWDTNSATPCASWPIDPTQWAAPASKSIPIHAVSDPWRSGRMFFNRSSTGDIIGLCSLEEDDHDCINLNGSPATDIGNFNNDVMGNQGGTMGVPLYIPDHNRLVVNIGHRSSDAPTQCWDFNSSSWCGEVSNGEFDYGYDFKGDCIYALGHDALFWTFNIGDMSPDCGTGTATTTIFPCVCYNGDVHWGRVLIDGDLDSTTGPWTQFDVSLTAPDGTVLQTNSLLDTDGLLSLDNISPDYPFLHLDVTAQSKPLSNPWAAGNVPTVIVGWSDKPHLVK